MTPLSYDKEKVFLWYNRDDIFTLITSFNNFKYYSFMSYNMDGTSNPPRRFITIIGKRRDCYNFYLKFCGVFQQPTNVFRDVDCWKVTRPYFSLNKEKYKKQRLEFFGSGQETPYRQHIFSSDFIFDIDAENPYVAWHTAKKVLDLLKKFNVMCSVYCSGKKGFQILIPYSKAIPKTYFKDSDGVEHNDHQAFAQNIKTYIDDKQDHICFSVYSDLHFVKQFYSLDVRTMTPIIPLSQKEFEDFINYEGKYNKYLDFDYWMKQSSFIDRGLAWWGFDNMVALDMFLDDFIEEKIR